MPSEKQKYRSECCALRNAIHRCHNTKNKQYKDYGGRGITVFQDWQGKDGFDLFLAHIGPKPSPELTLERLDNSKGYYPGNVGWRTRKDQQANRRGYKSSKTYLVNGSLYSVAELSRMSGIDASTIGFRARKGLTGTDLISPPDPAHQRY